MFKIHSTGFGKQMKLKRFQKKHRIVLILKVTIKYHIPYVLLNVIGVEKKHHTSKTIWKLGLKQSNLVRSTVYRSVIGNGLKIIKRKKKCRRAIITYNTKSRNGNNCRPSTVNAVYNTELSPCYFYVFELSPYR